MEPPLPVASSTLTPAFMMTSAEDLNILEILPLEILHAITINLKPKDRAACSLACKAWRRIVSSHLNLSRLLHLSNAMTTFKPALAPQLAALQQEMETALHPRGITARAWVQLRDTIAGDEELLNGRFFQTYGNQDVCRNAVLRKKVESRGSLDKSLLALVTDALQVHAVKEAQEAVYLTFRTYEGSQAVLTIVQYYTDHGQLDAAIDYLTRLPTTQTASNPRTSI